MPGQGSFLGGFERRSRPVQLAVPFRVTAEEQAWLGVGVDGATVADGSANHSDAVGVSQMSLRGIPTPVPEAT